MGDHLVICDRTGFKRWRSECKKEWDGKIVWAPVYRRRQPQDTPAIVPKSPTVVDARPDSPNTFVSLPPSNIWNN